MNALLYPHHTVVEISFFSTFLSKFPPVGGPDKFESNGTFVRISNDKTRNWEICKFGILKIDYKWGLVFDFCI